MTREEKQKTIDALKISAPVMAVTQEEFNDYIHTLNHVMDWLEKEPKTDVLDKIRAEIERLHYHPKLDFIKNDEVVEMVLDIIDKYKAKSEIKE